MSYRGGTLPPASDPVAVIDSVLPNPANVGNKITFTGHGIDDQNQIVAYKWTMDSNTILSDANTFTYSSIIAGTHIIGFQVEDAGGNWSPSVTMQLVISEPNILPSMPVAVVDSISPNPAATGQMITFIGHCIADKYPIIAGKWTLDSNTILSDANTFATSSINAGTHVIAYQVQDAGGNWSAAATMNLTVSDPNITVADIIIDNSDANNVTYTGKWTVSGVKGAYGTNSVAGTKGTFTWNFTPVVSGNYEVFMWWTQNVARANNAQVMITDSTGTSSGYVNQQSNGGKWNDLGQYKFMQGIKYNVTILTQADANFSTSLMRSKSSM